METLCTFQLSFLNTTRIQASVLQQG